MVHTSEGHVNEFQVFAAANDLTGQRHVGNHEDVGILGSLQLYSGRGVFFVGREFMAL